MDSHTATFDTYSALEAHVLGILCAHDDLEPKVTAIHRRTLWKARKTCAIFFHVRGPRLLKSYAVWTFDENRILFYDGVGNRFCETQLTDEVAVPAAILESRLSTSCQA